jgi:SAM-dependent methyltransferase
MTLSSEVAPRLPWPLPALGAWAVAWLSFWAAASAGLPAVWALLLALWLPLWLAWRSDSGLRRLMLVAGFPVALLLQGGVDLPPAAWLLPMTVLLLLYPVRAWRDAPVFPTRAAALEGLAQRLSPAVPASVLDAGCGLGDGLRALRAQWPQARLSGIEHSLPLALAAAVSCRDARIRRGDMWRHSWAGHDVVYVFQRPESMARAWAKACAELAPGSWLISLEFEVPGRPPDLRLHNPGQRPVLGWRVPPAAQCPQDAADKSRRRCPRAAD